MGRGGLGREGQKEKLVWRGGEDGWSWGEERRGMQGDYGRE